MLLSIVLELLPRESKIASGTSGRDTQAWFIKTVAEFDEALAKSIHPASVKGQDASGQQKRPYTTSGLMLSSGPDSSHEKAKTARKNRPLWKPVYTGYVFSESQPVYVRLSSLSAELSALLQSQIIHSLQGRVITLLETTFTIHAVHTTSEDHAWAGTSDYAQLVRQHQGPVGKQIDLEFASPTTFRSNQDDIPLPLPEHILRSWWLHWNAFSPPEFKIDMDWPRFAADCVRVTSLRNLSTTHWLFANGKRGGATGYYGQVALAVRPPRLDSPWAEHALGAEQVLRTLAAYSLYCGTGRQTTMGMGQTRLDQS